LDLVDLTGIEPAGDVPQASRRVPDDGHGPPTTERREELVDLTGIEPVTS
jgi:hypothetical protein